MGKFQSRKKGGLLARGKRGKTATSSSAREPQQHQSMGTYDDMEFKEDQEVGVLGNAGIHYRSVNVNDGLSNDLNSMRSPQPIRVGSKPAKKRAPATNRNRTKASSEPSPLEKAQALQGQLPTRSRQKQKANQPLGLEDVWSYNVPRKDSRSRRSDESASRRARAPLARHSHNRSAGNKESLLGRASGAISHVSSYISASIRRFSESPSKKRPHSSMSSSNSTENGEVVDLCDSDDDGGSSERYQEGDTTITEHSEDESSRRKMSSRWSKSTGRATSSASERSEESIRQSSSSSRDATPASSTKKRAARKSTASASSRNDTRNYSSGEKLEVVSSHSESNLSHTRFRAPNQEEPHVARGERAHGVSDLQFLKADELEEEDSGTNICNILDDIQDKPYGSEKDAPKKRHAATKPGTAKTAPKAALKSASSSSIFPSWGHDSSNGTAQKQQELTFTKVNSK